MKERRRWLGSAAEDTIYLGRLVPPGRRSETSEPGAAVGHLFGLRVAFASPEVLRARPAAYWLTPNEVEEFLAGGMRVLAVEAPSGEVLYRAIVSREAEPEAVLSDTACPAPALILTSAWTGPAHRGRGVQGAALEWLAASAAEEGCRAIAVWVSRWNSSSLRSFAKAGFRLLPPRRPLAPPARGRPAMSPSAAWPIGR